MQNILLVEDDPFFRANLASKLKKYGRVLEARNLVEAKRKIKSVPNIAFIDLDLISSLDGLKILEVCPKNTISVILTSHEDKETIKKASENGCNYYFSKLNFLENFDEVAAQVFSEDNHFKYLFENEFVTTDIGLKEKISFFINQSKHKNLPMLITGPTGVGKSSLVKTIHKNYFKNKPLVHVNLSELSKNLIESELFGHKKGSFTGALNDKEGLLKQADQGILFLDEIGTLSIELQRKLLRVIEEKSFSPVGSNETISTNFKLISATCDNLSQKLQNKDMRVDFYFRIKGSEINIPPLSKRVEDIEALIDFFISKSSKKIVFSDDSLNILKQYKWPGNIRELSSLIKELTLLNKTIIKSEDLPNHILENKSIFDEQEDEPLLSSRNKDFIEEFGLPELIKQIELEAFKLSAKELKGKTNQIIKSLKISKSVFYRIQNLVNGVEI